jgi:uncharacterized repeat protein (TIGR02543 family)
MLVFAGCEDLLTFKHKDPETGEPVIIRVLVSDSFSNLTNGVVQNDFDAGETVYFGLTVKDTDFDLDKIIITQKSATQIIDPVEIKIQVQLKSTDFYYANTNPNLPGTWTIEGYAVDKKGNTSNVFIRTISIREKEIITYTVSFNSTGGNEISPITGIVSGNKITKPDDPAKPGWFFDEWYKNEELTEKWNFDDDYVSCDITLYAKWTTTPKFNSLNVLETYLNAQPPNDPMNPYQIILTAFESVEYLYATIYSAVGSSESGIGYRYVSLDLSRASGITNWPETQNNNGKKQIISLVFPDSVIDISDGAISGYDGFGTNLRSVTGKNVKRIGWSSFVYCRNLEYVDFPNVQKIELFGFADCVGLVNIDFQNVTELVSGVFRDCNNLVSVNLPKAKYIGDSVFKGCVKLSSVIMPEVIQIRYNAFEDCVSLITLDLPMVNTIGDYVFAKCSSLSMVTFPEIASIGVSAFMDCTKLAIVKIPNISHLDGSVFENCLNLESITLGDFPPSFHLLFSGNKPNAVIIYVPIGKLSVYELWKSNYSKGFSDVKIIIQEKM